MKVFTCTNFRGHYPIGVAAVIVAPNEAIAKAKLLMQLAEEELPQTVTEIAQLQLEEVDTDVMQALTLHVGNY